MPHPDARAVVATLTLVLLGGCAADDWSRPHDGPVVVGALGAGFLDPGESPTPEATIAPETGSWDAIFPREGYRVVLVTRGDDEPTQSLVAAVRDWAEATDVDLRTLEPSTPADLVPAVAEAVGMGADLVISAGDDLVDPLAVVSANHLDQQFLVVGAEVAEPTGNVTAVGWTGASYRGADAGAASAPDPATFTTRRCAAAVRAGVAAVLGEVTGVVVWID